MKCLAILCLPMTFPTLIPVLSGSFSRPAAADAAILSRSASVAVSSAWRLLARSAARNGLQQQPGRPPGGSGWLIPAKSCTWDGDIGGPPAVAGRGRDRGGAQRG